MPFPAKPVDPARLRSIDALTRFGIELLQEERAAILSGAFDRLDDLSARKAALLDEIESRTQATEHEGTPSERETRRESLHGAAAILSRRASENQNLLSAAMDGARKAGEMIERLRTGGAAGFYGASGERVATAAGGGRGLKL